MCSITGDGERLHNVLRQIGSKPCRPWQQKPPLTYNGEWCLYLFSGAFDLILFILAGNEDMHKISEASWPILIKFYVKHHWGRGKAAQGVGGDWIKTVTLVSMATESPIDL